MSALPKAVQSQVDEANKIVENMATGKPLDEAGNIIEDPIPEGVNPPANPVVVPEIPAVVEPAAVVEPVVPVVPATPVVEDTMEHKYKVLQGKYNAEVPLLRRQVKDADNQIGDMRQRLTNTESLLASLQHVQTPAEPAVPVPSNLPVVTEAETAQFGPDLEDYIERVAARKVMPLVDSSIKSLDTRFDGIEQSASQQATSVARSDRDKVMAALAAAVPDWEQQNEKPEFLNWLNEVDAYAGVQRGQLLTQAFRSNDSVRVIAFFKGFQTENAVVAPAGEVTPAPVVAPEPQQNLNDLVAPGTPKTGTTSAPNESGKRVWTHADIQSFYAAKNGFITKGKPIPKEYVEAEKDLFKAQTEGRIR